LFSKAQIVHKHSRLWITAGKSRVDALNQDYRNIIEGLQVNITSDSSRNFFQYRNTISSAVIFMASKTGWLTFYFYFFLLYIAYGFSIKFNE